jgi:lipopolysaccharide export system protein LptA
MSGNSAKMVVCAGLLLGVLMASAGVQAEDAKTKAVIDRDHPLQVDSDRLDAFNDKQTVVFSGNVVASQGIRTIHSDTLTIYYKNDKKASAQTAASDKKSGNIDRIEAKGRVTVVEGERKATGDFAVFEQNAQKITLTGDAVLKEGENIIKGSKVTIFLQENRGVVEGGQDRRVSATIFPGEKK